MKNSACLLALVVAVCSGCSTLEKNTAVAALPPAPVKPPAPVAGTEMDQGNVEKVRFNESLKAYPVNRYVDPNDPNVMHEGHVLYRRENTGGWNLNPNAPTVVPLGPALAVADGARVPNRRPAELETKMAEQKQLMASLIEQNETLSKELARINEGKGEIRQRGAIAAREGKQ